jgi:hypothetical protein
VRVYEKKSRLMGTIRGCGCSIEENAVFEGKVLRDDFLESFIGSVANQLTASICTLVLAKQVRLY